MDIPNRQTLLKLRAGVKKSVKIMKAKACIRSEEDYCPGNCDKRGRVSLYKLFDEPKYELKTYEIKKLIQILARREESENLDVPTFVDLLEVILKPH